MDLKTLDKLHFNNPQFKEVMEKIVEVVIPRATQRKEKRKLSHLIIQLGELFEEDSKVIRDLFEMKIIEEEVKVSGGGSRFMPSAFSSPGRYNEEGCKDCPDGVIQSLEKGVGVKANVKQVEVGGKMIRVIDEREEKKLPEELYEEEEEREKMVNKVRDIETFADAKILFQYGKRPAQDIKNDIKSWFVDNELNYNTLESSGVLKWIEEWLDLVVINPLQK